MLAVVSNLIRNWGYKICKDHLRELLGFPSENEVQLLTRGAWAADSLFCWIAQLQLTEETYIKYSSPRLWHSTSKHEWKSALCHQDIKQAIEVYKHIKRWRVQAMNRMSTVIFCAINGQNDEFNSWNCPRKKPSGKLVYFLQLAGNVELYCYHLCFISEIPKSMHVCALAMHVENYFQAPTDIVQWP